MKTKIGNSLRIASLTALLLLGFVSTIVLVQANGEHEHGAHLTLRATETDLTTIALDGDSSDWAAVGGLSFTIVPIERDEVPNDDRQLDVNVRVAFDADNIAVLVEIQDNYAFNSSDHHLSGHVAVMWAIDEEAGPHMGMDDAGVSQGKVDIWHWELETAPGTIVGGKGTATSGDDPVGNFDDEWATSSENRHDDAAENSLFGNWNHTDIAGSRGHYVFEMKRALETTDDNDTQFSENSVYKMGVAYWDPDETPTGWEDDGHLVSAETVGWLNIELGEPASQSTPGFTVIALVVSLTAVTIGTGFFRKKGRKG
ncbi:MAG: ethylbenzene dehydrogenase-related protein [Candidatus Thorarchaeota archaeon]